MNNVRHTALNSVQNHNPI